MKYCSQNNEELLNKIVAYSTPELGRIIDTIFEK